MIEFVTIFLGLMVGAHDVEVMVDVDVARVELLLDGAQVAAITDAPWRASVDFGEELGIRTLTAVARDAAGVEVGRTSQTINAPRPPAEVELLLEHDGAGELEAVRLAWQSTEHERPDEVIVTLDGQRLLQLAPDRFGLPPIDEDDFHVLQADVRFSGGLRAHGTLTFGGRYLAETRGELTAVLVSMKGRGRAPEPDEMGGWFTIAESPLSVAAVEEGPVEVLVVRTDGVANATLMLSGAPTRRMKDALSVSADHHLRLLEPRASKVARGHLSYDSFLGSPVLDRRMGVFWALIQRFDLEDTAPAPRIADAVAVAGLQASAGNRRRAVVLATAPGARDLSTIRPSAATRYLAALQVPLYVWHFGGGEPLAGWPEATRIDSYPALRRAVRALEKAVERQRVVWLEEGHDARSVQLARHDRFTLVGEPL